MSVFKKPKAPAKTAEQVAGEKRTRSLLDKEIGESEELFKTLTSKTLGRSSLLTGAPTSIANAASRKSVGGGGGGGSLLPGAGKASAVRTGNLPGNRTPGRGGKR